MERALLESIFVISVIFLIFYYIKLLKDVIILRKKKKISLGSGNVKELERAIRAHSNFNENVPIGLILLMFLYFHNYLLICSLSVILLLFGRLMHSKGILNIDEDKMSFNLRQKGMKLTYYSYLISIFGLILYIMQTLYFFVENIRH